MKKGIGILLVGLMILSCGVSLVLAKTELGLDGKTFTGEIAPMGKEQGDADTFIFQNGTFRSTACDSIGFTESSYTTAQAGDAVTFQSETVSPTAGKMVWKGKVEAGRIEGIATLTGTDEKPVEHWFKGELEQE